MLESGFRIDSRSQISRLEYTILNLELGAGFGGSGIWTSSVTRSDAISVLLQSETGTILALCLLKANVLPGFVKWALVTFSRGFPRTMRGLISYAICAISILLHSITLLCLAGPVDLPDRSFRALAVALRDIGEHVAHPRSADITKRQAIEQSTLPDRHEPITSQLSSVSPTLTERGISASMGNATHLIWQTVSIVLNAPTAAVIALKRLYNGLLEFLRDPVAVENARVLTGQLYVGMATLTIFFMPVPDERRDLAAVVQRFAQMMLRFLVMGVVYGTYHAAILTAQGALWVSLWINQNGGGAIVGRRDMARISHPNYNQFQPSSGAN